MVDQMTAGENLDREIDERLFGRTFSLFPMGWCYHNGRGWVKPAPYSTDWNFMRLVIEEMERRGLSLFFNNYDEKGWYRGHFKDGEANSHRGACGPELSHVVCLAALEAIKEREEV